MKESQQENKIKEKRRNIIYLFNLVANNYRINKDRKFLLLLYISSLPLTYVSQRLDSYTSDSVASASLIFFFFKKISIATDKLALFSPSLAIPSLATQVSERQGEERVKQIKRKYRGINNSSQIISPILFPYNKFFI